jgi:hypothetical protein
MYIVQLVISVCHANVKHPNHARPKRHAATNIPPCYRAEQSATPQRFRWARV